MRQCEPQQRRTGWSPPTGDVQPVVFVRELRYKWHEQLTLNDEDRQRKTAAHAAVPSFASWSLASVLRGSCQPVAQALTTTV